MSKWYGNINNRIDENKMYCKKIEIGTKLTEYLWSDREVYEVVDIKNQNDVYIRKLDHKAIGEPMSNNWKLTSNENNPIKELQKRYNKWNWVSIITKESINNSIILDDKLFKAKQKIESGANEVKVFRDANVSFGIADYYFDYEF